MEQQSKATLTTEDKIVAVILSMRELGLDFILSPDLPHQNVELIAHIDTIVNQRLVEPINLQPANILATFETKCNIVTGVRENRRIESGIDAAMASLEETISTQDKEDYHTDWTDDSDFVDTYNSDDDQCGCYSAFGMNDDGEVRHYGSNCQYGS